MSVTSGIIAGLTVAGLTAFANHFNGDQVWECGPAEIPKEIGLLNSRGSDIYPQGRDNCRRFLQYCQRNNLRFRIKAQKTFPFWTWYYEVIG